jgi:hypothetical protein
MIILCLKSAKYSTSEAGELENMKELWDIPSHRSNSLSVIDLAGSDRVFTPSHVTCLQCKCENVHDGRWAMVELFYFT